MYFTNSNLPGSLFAHMSPGLVHFPWVKFLIKDNMGLDSFPSFPQIKAKAYPTSISPLLGCAWPHMASTPLLTG